MTLNSPHNHIIITANTSWYIYNFRLNLIQALLQENYKVTVVSPFDKYSNKLIEIGCQYHNIKIDQGGTNPFKDLITVFSFLHLFRKTKPNLVLSFTPKNNIYGTLSAAFLGIRTVNNIAGLGSIFIEQGTLAALVRYLYRTSQKYAGKIYFQNTDDLELFNKANIAKNVPTALLPGSGVDLLRFTPTALPGKEGVNFILVSRLLYEKGILNYVKAAEILRLKYPTVKFRILGMIDNRNPSAVPEKILNEWVKSGAISYLGSSDRIEDHLAEADCVVLPSYYREGVPRSLLEGAAMARPIITTNNTGCKETLIDEVSGYLCKPRNTDSLITAMEKIISMSPECRTNMGLQGRKFMECRYDEKIVIQSYLKTVKSLLEETYK